MGATNLTALDGMDGHEDHFEAHRDRLFGIAYRMTGSVADAQDTLQEAWLRWQRVELSGVERPEAYLVSIVTRLAIDRGRAAHVRRERYVGPWLPEPLVQGPLVTNGPEAAAETADSLTFAFLVLLDALSPLERAVFLLREVFAYRYDEVAAATGRTPEACRQMVSRIRRRLDADRVESRPVAADREQELVGRMLVAIAVGDIDGLLKLLSPDVVLLSDGGPDRHAARRPVVGAHRVARLCIGLGKRIDPASVPEFVRVNGAAGIVMRIDGHTDYVLLAEYGPNGLVRGIYFQMNPTKLSHLNE